MNSKHEIFGSLTTFYYQIILGCTLLIRNWESRILHHSTKFQNLKINYTEATDSEIDIDTLFIPMEKFMCLATHESGNTKGTM